MGDMPLRRAHPICINSRLEWLDMPLDSAAELVVENIVKEYPTPAEPLRVLSGVSFSLRRGENLAILGPSGSGKSTLLSILGTLEPPTSGGVQLTGKNPFALKEAELAAFRRENIGFVFQE